MRAEGEVRWTKSGERGSECMTAEGEKEKKLESWGLKKEGESI